MQRNPQFMKAVLVFGMLFASGLVAPALAETTPGANAGGASDINKGKAMFSQTEKPKAGDTIAVIKTNQGTMKAVIFTDVVPASAKNFVELAKQGKYTNVPFHRVIKNFMIQGGDFERKNGTGGYSAAGEGTTIADEYNPSLTHIRGAVAWAKTAAPKSIGSQFYIVHPEKGAHFLDHPANGGPADGYSVFGQLFEGFDVLDKIATTQTGANDKPVEPMMIESVTIETMQ